MINRRNALLGSMSMLMADHAFSAIDSTYPNRSIKIISPSGAGTGSDIMARAVATRMSQILGQSMPVDNKPGANGVLGLGEAAKAEPDGYTLLVCGFASMVINPWLYKSLPYKPMSDFAPIAQLGGGGVVLLANPRHPAQNLQGFIEWAKAQRKPPIYATWGVGSSAHASMEAMASTIGVKFEHVTYKTIGQLLTDLSAGQIDIGWADPASPMALINDGRIRALGIAASQRAPLLPDVPRLIEAGIPVDMDGWYGLFCRAGTPKEIVAKLVAAARETIQDPSFKDLLTKMNSSSSQMETPEQFEKLIRSDTKRWGKLMTQIGLAAS